MKLQSINKKVTFKNLSYFGLVCLLILGSLFGKLIVADGTGTSKTDLSTLTGELVVNNDNDNTIIEAFVKKHSDKGFTKEDLNVNVDKKDKKATFKPSDKGKNKCNSEITVTYSIIIDLSTLQEDLVVADEEENTLKDAFIAKHSDKGFTKEDLNVNVDKKDKKAIFTATNNDKYKNKAEVKYSFSSWYTSWFFIIAVILVIVIAVTYFFIVMKKNK